MSLSIAGVRDILTNPKHTRWIAPLILLGEAVLCGLIVWRIPCSLDSHRPLHPYPADP